jgi:hypothetical protein
MCRLAITWRRCTPLAPIFGWRGRLPAGGRAARRPATLGKVPEFAIGLFSGKRAGARRVIALQVNAPEPSGRKGMTPALALNTAISFTTNTSRQNYPGESTLGDIGLVAGLGVQAFASAAGGMCGGCVDSRAHRNTERRTGQFLGGSGADSGPHPAAVGDHLEGHAACSGRRRRLRWSSRDLDASHSARVRPDLALGPVADTLGRPPVSTARQGLIWRRQDVAKSMVSMPYLRDYRIGALWH